MNELEPKPPELIQNIEWFRRHGKKHWKVVICALLFVAAIAGLRLFTSKDESKGKDSHVGSNKKPDVNPAGQQTMTKTTETIKEPTVTPATPHKPEPSPIPKKKTKLQDQPELQASQTALPSSINATNSNVLIGPATNVTQTIINARPVPRVLTPEQEADLIAKLSPQGPELRAIAIESVAGDRESNDFARQIEDVLKRANWAVDGNKVGMSPKTPTGLKLIAKQPGKLPKHLSKLLLTLQSIGYPVKAYANPNCEYDHLLIVGVKP